MTYLLLNLGFLLGALALWLSALARAGHLRKPFLIATAWTALVLVSLTIVFDNLMILVGLVDYGQAQISGIKLGIMPIEDLSYTFFAVFALPAVWLLTTRRP